MKNESHDHNYQYQGANCRINITPDKALSFHPVHELQYLAPQMPPPEHRKLAAHPVIAKQLSQ